MQDPVTRLYPSHQQAVTLEGLYLAHNLHERGTVEKPFVYSNFITSLDGRIVVAAQARATHEVPSAITNPRDWRLYQELAGQADVLITSGRYFRQSAVGEEQDTLPVGGQAHFADIHRWRERKGLAAQPDIAIMSASLDIPPASLETYQSRRVYIFTGELADRRRVRELEAAGATVIAAGPGHQVEGRRMVELLAGEGYCSIYAVAGPWVFHTLLAAGVLDRLYLTTACRFLGGMEYDTLLEGELLDPSVSMQLVMLHHDPHAPAGGQLLAVYEPLAK